MAERGDGHKDASGHNGRRSRGGRSSNNGHTAQGGSDCTSSNDEGEEGGGMRVGHEYQAVIPDYIPIQDRLPEQCPTMDLQIWTPTTDIPDYRMDEYILLAKEKYGLSVEQALGMLHWNKHDLQKAILILGDFTPLQDQWTVEEKVLFEEAFHIHGKRFHRIQLMLPNKSISSLVKYYYSWKKKRTPPTTVDRLAKRLAEHTSKEPQHHNPQYHHHPQHLVMQHSRRPPRRMCTKRGDVVAMANGPPGQGDRMLKAVVRELGSLKRQVQNNTQMINNLKRITGDGEEFRGNGGTRRINAKWTNSELLLAVEGVRKYGKNFKAIAEVIGTKTEDHLLYFFLNYRRRFKLDAVLKEYEVENGLRAHEDEKDTKGEAKGE